MAQPQPVPRAAPRVHVEEEGALLLEDVERHEEAVDEIKLHSKHMLAADSAHLSWLSLSLSES